MRFEYIKPKTLKEAIELLSSGNGQSKVIAGGTDLVVQMRDRLIRPGNVIDITGIEELSYIDINDEKGLLIGALTPIRDLEKSAELKRSYPIISQAASQLGSVAIRTMGTIGGNLCNASPSAETAPALIVLSAKARIVGPSGERVVPLEDFFVGPGSTALEAGELLVEIQVPAPLPHTRGIYLKHAIRGSIDLAIVGVAVALTIETKSKVCQDIKIALGAVAPTPIRARKAEKILIGNTINDDLICRCAQAAADEARPISDARASAEYRKEMVKVFTGRAIREAMSE